MKSKLAVGSANRSDGSLLGSTRCATKMEVLTTPRETLPLLQAWRSRTMLITSMITSMITQM